MSRQNNIGRILILGGTGMLGHVLLRYFVKESRYEIYATSRDTAKLQDILPKDVANRFLPDNLDASNPEDIINVIQKLQPSLVVNCIGIIKQLPSSKDPVISVRINALFPHLVARVCRDRGIRMIHISTDCVFNGKKGMYTEDDEPAPDDLYGRTKLIGEIDYPGCVTLRTSIIGHELRSRYGLVEWFLSEKGPVKGYTNAIYTGFPTIEFARIIHRYVIPASDLSGVYHVSSEPISKFDLLQLISNKYGRSTYIEPYNGIFLDRSLQSDRFRTKTGYTPPPWTELINAMFDDYATNCEDYVK